MSSPQISRRKKIIGCHIESLESRIAPAAFVVTNLNDSGAGSLRDAIAKANATAAPDTITFSATAHGIIDLTSGELLISYPLTINGADLVTIDAQSQSRIFRIDDGDNTTDSPVTISGLALLHGQVLNDSGGAINSAEGLTLNNVTISGSHADNNGGGVLVATTTGAVVVKNSHFTHNEAVNSSGNTFNDRGGGLFVEATKAISITGSQFIGNDSQSTGGGAYLIANAVTTKISVTGSLFTHNTAGVVSDGPDIAGVGGGLYILGVTSQTAASTGTISKSQFIANVSDSSSGGVHLDSGNFAVTGSLIYGNSATDNVGGGLQAAGTLRKLNISNTVVDGNTAGHQGGGLFVFAVSSTTSISITGSSIIGNTAGQTGGGLDLTGVSLANAITISATKISGNTADQAGGGAHFTGGGKVTITGSTFDLNAASGTGGALAAEQGVNSLSLMKSFITNNRTSSLAGGGGVSLSGVPTATITSTQFTDNAATDSDADGGGLIMGGGAGTLTVTGSTFSHNFAGDTGGGLAVSGSAGNITTKISASTISENHSGGVGGGLHLQPGGAITFTNVSVINNFSSTDTGGAFLLTNGGITITGGTISHNVASTGVGGLTLAESTGTDVPAAISKTTFIGNDGGTAGGVLVSGQLTAHFTSVRITQNIGQNGAGGLERQNLATVTMTKSTVFGNIDVANAAFDDTKI